MIDSDILAFLNEKYDHRYEFLRLGYVRIVVEEKKATVGFLVPDEVFDYKLKKEDVENIKNGVKEALGGTFGVACKFDKIVLTEESVKSFLAEYMSKYFPMILANIDFSRVKVAFGDPIELCFSVPENLCSYIEKVDFEKRLPTVFSSKFAAQAKIKFEIWEGYVPSTSPESRPTSVGRYGKSVEVTEKQSVFGKEADLRGPAVHISTLKGDGEDVLCCGKVTHLAFKTRDEKKKGEYKKFFKHYYTFSISDTTGFLNVFINTNDVISALEDGKDVICRGRVNLRDDAVNFSMYAKAVGTCVIPYSLIAEQTKPLDPPAEYSVLRPTHYEEVSYDQIGLFSSGDVRPLNQTPCVTVAIKSLRNEQKVLIPYEIAMCKVREGRITEYIHTFLRVAFTDDSEKAQYANRKGYASPRLSTVIPDLIKFSDGELVVGLNPNAAIDLLNVTARSLRYQFQNELHTVQASSLSDDDKSSDGALAEAVAVANAFLRE